MTRTCTVVHPRDSYQSAVGCRDVGKDAIYFFFFLIEQCQIKGLPMVTQLEEQNNQRLKLLLLDSLAYPGALGLEFGEGGGLQYVWF